MTLRPATLDDTASLHALEQRLFEPHNYPISRRMFRHHLTCNLLYVALGENEELLGYALMLVRGRKSAKLYSLGVDVRARGQGVAHALLERLVNEACALPMRRIVLEVRTDNKGAIHLYEKHGFVTLRRLAGFYRDGCDALLMQRPCCGSAL